MIDAQQIKDLADRLDALGGVRPYITIRDGVHVYVMSERDWITNQPSPAVCGDDEQRKRRDEFTEYMHYQAKRLDGGDDERLITYRPKDD